MSTCAAPFMPSSLRAWKALLDRGLRIEVMAVARTWKELSRARTPLPVPHPLTVGYGIMSNYMP